MIERDHPDLSIRQQYLPLLGRLLRNRLPGSECAADFSIWWRLWTGTPEWFCRGG